MSREIHLLLPDLLVKGLGQSGISLPPLPALERLLGRAERRAHPHRDPERYVCALLGIGQGEPPLGALCRLADTGRRDSRWWFRAAPVHLTADRDRLLLDPESPVLSPEEAASLISELNGHFREDGLVLEMGSPSRWYLAAPQPPGMKTRAPEEVGRGDIRPFLPSGTDALRWHSLLNEAQMLLHASPVNAERQARGLKPANALWIWGGGVLPERSELRKFEIRASEDACASRGLAGLTGAEAGKLPVSAEPVLASPGSRSIVVATEFRELLQRRDLDGWLRAIEQWEEKWFEPLLAKLLKGRLRRLELWGGGNERFVLTPGLAWRIWRARRSPARIE